MYSAEDNVSMVNFFNIDIKDYSSHAMKTSLSQLHMLVQRIFFIKIADV